MDTPRYDNLLRSLAFKLRDPIANEEGQEDGKVFKLHSKVNYINRGYGAMRRKIAAIVSKPEKIFPDFYRMVDYPVPADVEYVRDLTINLADIVTNETVFDVHDIYLDITTPGSATVETLQAAQIDPESFISAKYGASQVYTPSDEAHLYFWSVINGEIVFLAEDARANKVHLFLKNATPEFYHAGEKDLVIPRELNDFLLTCAAYEAMIDLGDNKAIQKAVMYDKWLKNELEILMIKEKIAKSAEDDRSTK